MSKLSIIDEIAQYFNRHEQAERIKKLMYYASTKKWESDAKKVMMLSAKDLVEQLRDNNRTIDELSYLMTSMVETLNRQDIYSSIANLIIQNLSKLYNDSEDTTQIVFVESKPKKDVVIHDYLIDRVVASLEENIDSARIKKLMFCVCKKRWENNNHILEQYSWHDLIYELRQQNQTDHQLKQALMAVVKTLNRQAIYSNIANIIQQSMDILYKPVEVQEAQEAQKSQKSQKSQKEKASSNQGINSFETALVHGDLDYFYEEQGLVSSSSLKQEQPSEQTTEDTNVKGQQGQKEYDGFEVKMSLMQYANPLRAKILLFSVLNHHFDDNWQDWSVLRACELDDLLKQIYNQTNSVNELESSLKDTAKFLVDKSEYTPVTHAIVKALKPYYPN